MELERSHALLQICVSFEYHVFWRMRSLEPHCTSGLLLHLYCSAGWYVALENGGLLGHLLSVCGRLNVIFVLCMLAMGVLLCEAAWICYGYALGLLSGYDL